MTFYIHRMLLKSDCRVRTGVQGYSAIESIIIIVCMHNIVLYFIYFFHKFDRRPCENQKIR